MSKNLKIVTIILILIFILCSCGKSIKPSNILIGDKKISYLDSKQTIEEILGTGVEEKIKFFHGYNYGDIIQVAYNSESSSRFIMITNNKVKTFNEISVGDKISKVKKAYKYEHEFGSTFSVLFNGTEEINSIEKDKLDEWIWIDYKVNDDNIIESISIYDVLYGKMQK